MANAGLCQIECYVIFKSYFLKVADLQVPNLKSFPSIKWEGGFNKFSFTNGNTLYEQECTLPKKSSKAIANYPEDAENVDIAYSTDKIAYTVGNNLYISSGMGQSAKITDETNADIVCGQAAHRNEFGITKGTFWSNKQTKIVTEEEVAAIKK